MFDHDKKFDRSLAKKYGQPYKQCLLRLDEIWKFTRSDINRIIFSKAPARKRIAVMEAKNLIIVRRSDTLYKHIIWDFDGTLFDSYPAMGCAFQEMLREQGIEESLDEILKHMKVSMGHAICHYEKKYSIDSAWIESYQKRRKELEISLCKPYPGIEEVCKYILDSGKSNYLYTHRGKSAIEFLKKYDLYGFFADCITSHRGFERKPSPDAIKYLIKKFKMNPKETLMIGDRDLDILSAKNAGIHGCFFTEMDKKSDMADFTICSFQELYTILI